MKKHSKHAKKPLALDKQTIKELGGDQMKQVVGGSCLEIKPPAV